MGPGLIQSARDPAGRDPKRRAAEIRVGGLKARLAHLDERLEKLNLQTRAAGADELKLEYARQDLARAESYRDSANRGLERSSRRPGSRSPGSAGNTAPSRRAGPRSATGSR